MWTADNTKRINVHAYPAEAGSQVLILRGDQHEILNTGQSPLQTLNIYVRPTYPSGGSLTGAFDIATVSVDDVVSREVVVLFF